MQNSKSDEPLISKIILITFDPANETFFLKEILDAELTTQLTVD